ncbi:MAG: hypothetical protein JSW60_06550 [Thermoplasmatales archaeon]|nr:MAG: hypothetical protein JSW60_06550 [Thermoplasmatales archaeon]
MDKTKLETAIGTSRKWDAREAGREVARNTIKNLNAPPNFFLLFSSIHYETHGGFQEFLNGVWEVLPEGTPLVGGTVSGFINPQGCYTRGATALAMSYPNMNVAIGVGYNTKRNPKKAAMQATKMIKQKLDFTYRNRFLLQLVSAGNVPNIIARKKVVKGISKTLALNLYGFSLKVLQTGVGREDEIHDITTNEFKEFNILGGSLLDSMRIMNNYQFYNKKVLENALLLLAMSLDLNTNVCTTLGMKETDNEFTITKMSADKRVVHEIDGKPASKRLLELLNWPEDYFDETIYRRIFYYPLAFKDGDRIIPEVIPLVLGDSLLFTYQTKNPKVTILSTSGEGLISAVTENLDKHRSITPALGLISSCAIRLQTLGSNIFKVREALMDYFKEKPFLLFYVGGEMSYSPENGLRYGNDTFNTAIFW